MLVALVLSTVVVAASVPSPAADTRNLNPQQAQSVPEKPWPPEGVVRAGTDTSLVAPRLVRDVKPQYTREARDARIGGVVILEAVVEKDGKVGEVRVKHSLDREFGLDDEAVRALKQWEFTPGTKDGVLVPVLVEVEMTFTLRG